MAGGRPIGRVGVYYHPRRAEALQLAEAVRGWLDGSVEEVWTSTPWEQPRSTERLPETDLLICLGGDGTVLGAARAAAGYDIPILGVDQGRLAFLTELAPDALEAHIPRLLRRGFRIEERMMLEAIPHDGDGAPLDPLPALNDVIVGRGSLGRPSDLHVEVDGEVIGEVRADAIVVASATGSTGYSLSAGGPILHPQARSIVLTPVSPHLAAAAPLVLPADSRISLRIEAEEPGLLSVDGQQPRGLAPSESVEVRRSASTAKFVRFDERPFFAQLTERLAWLDERRLRALQRKGGDPS